jgi:hypothetical protein
VQLGIVVLDLEPAVAPDGKARALLEAGLDLIGGQQDGELVQPCILRADISRRTTRSSAGSPMTSASFCAMRSVGGAVNR